MPENLRELLESPWRQGRNEIWAYRFNSLPWGGGTPSAIIATLYDVSPPGALVDVSATKLLGTATADGLIITTPAVRLLEPDHKYRLEIMWTHLGNTSETFGIIDAEL